MSFKKYNDTLRKMLLIMAPGWGATTVDLTLECAIKKRKMILSGWHGGSGIF